MSLDSATPQREIREFGPMKASIYVKLTFFSECDLLLDLFDRVPGLT